MAKARTKKGEEDLVGTVIVSQKTTPEKDASESPLAKALRENELSLREARTYKLGDDTATKAGASNEATPAPNQKYGAELVKALEHITQGKSIQVDLKTEYELQKGVEKLVIAGDVEQVVPALREMGYILNQSDTKYLRIAVRYANDQSLKNTLLVFHRSV
ncbi:MAG: hypothetical protein V4714_08210 [Bacteroidota bacterium]